MPRRGYDRRKQCAHTDRDGTRCREVSFVHYDYKRDYVEAYRREQGKPWLCLRHANPEEVLSVHNLQVVSDPSREESNDRFWGRSGVVFGPGFRAWAKDFPVGTRLALTAILPENYEIPAPQAARPAWHTDAVDLDK